MFATSFHFVDDSQGAAGVEDSSMYLQLEKRKGNMTPELSGTLSASGLSKWLL